MKSINLLSYGINKKTQITRTLFIAITSFLFIFCENQETYENKILSFELDPITNDTINVTTPKGKQGRWFIKTDCAAGLPKIPKDSIKGIDSTLKAEIVFQPAVLSVGRYMDDKKHGTWTYYNEDGSVNKMEVYQDGKLIANQ